MATKSQTRSLEETEKLLSVAKERYAQVIENEGDIRRLETEDMEFRAGKQWPDEIKNQREVDRRPCLTINRLPQFVRQVTNDQRQNRPAIRVSPVDDKADPEIAEIFQGMIRHVEQYSNADVAYDTAFENAVIRGRGFFRIITDYCDPSSFDQEILFKSILNPQSVKFDPFSKEPDGSDANWAIIDIRMSKDDFKAEFGESELAKHSDWEELAGKDHEWIEKDACKIAEYFFKTFKEVEIALLADGSSVPLDQVPKGQEPVKTRKTTLPAIKWMKINAIEVLEETDWLGKWIPVVPVYGDILDVNGKKVYEGIIRHAKDPQRMYNYWASAETEGIALAPKAPFIVAEGQIEDYEDQWKTANVKNHAYLVYKPTDLSGQPAPPPQRQSVEPAVQAITGARAVSAEDLKATTGIYDPTLGNREGDQSGNAIRRLQAQAQTSNFHFVDNLRRSQRHAGRICVDLMPKVYDTARAIRSIGTDDQEEIVLINQIFEKNGKQKAYFLNAGQYDVVCDNGPSYATKRQEAVASMLDFIKVVPQAGPLIGDLIAGDMDWEGSREIAQRLKAMVPPQALASDNDDIPPQAQAMIKQLQGQLQAMQGQFAAADQIVKNKMLETSSRERIEMAKVKADLEINLAKLQAQGAETLLEHDIGRIQRREDQLNQENNPTGGASPGAATGGQSPGTNPGANP